MIYRLTLDTMLRVREWERYKFLVDYEHRQVRRTSIVDNLNRNFADMWRFCSGIAKGYSSEAIARDIEALHCPENRRQSLFKGLDLFVLN